MKLAENRKMPVPSVNPLQTLVIELTVDEVEFIQQNAVLLGNARWTIRDSPTAYYLIEAIRKVKLCPLKFGTGPS